jgi:hypothetical protein
VAWAYSSDRALDEFSSRRWPSAIASAQGWTETPLYTRPIETPDAREIVAGLVEACNVAAQEIRASLPWAGDEAKGDMTRAAVDCEQKAEAGRAWMEKKL